MLKLVKRHGSQYFYLRGTVRGITIDESTGIALGNKTAANDVRIKREAEVLEESIHGKRAVATFSQAALSYIEAGGEQTFLEPILLHFGAAKRLSVIGQNDIDQCARKLYPDLMDSSRNRLVYTPISAILRHAAKRGWCNEFSIERPPETEPRVRWLTHDEAMRLIDYCKPWFRPLVIFMFYTGARVGEALWLDWKNLDIDRRHVQFIDTKNGESRGVPLHARITEMLRVVNDRTGFVFNKKNGEPFRALTNSDRSAGTRIYETFLGACKRAGIDDFHPHDCRHTWATWHYQANRDLGALQKLGGWKSLDMVMRYAHTNVAELDQTIDRIR
jgi:integrase